MCVCVCVQAGTAAMVTETASAAAAVAAEKTAESYKDASAGIDNMMNALIDKAALVTKHWKLRPEESDPPFYLTVRHYSMTKMYILSISGLLVLVNSKVVYRHTVRPHTQARLSGPSNQRPGQDCLPSLPGGGCVCVTRPAMRALCRTRLRTSLRCRSH